ncbi:porin family protein [Maribacter algicola]|uniref:Porin family protein n=1 Tax=Meishania litoralis TaxID=3434685 RepID=A0ACC7LNY0_9FLAO
MNRAFFSFVFFLVLTISTLSAQTVIKGTSLVGNGSGDILFGAKAGLVVSDLRGDGIVDNTPHIGFQVGGIAEIPIAEDIYLDPELLLTLQGTRGIGDNLNLFYVNIPVMGKYHITDEIAVELGPQLGVLLGGNYDDFNIDAKTIDVGLGIGGGYRLDSNIYLQLRFNTGFIKVFENLDTYNIAAQIGASYFF